MPHTAHGSQNRSPGQCADGVYQDGGAAMATADRHTILIARFMGPTWGPSGADSTQVGPIFANVILDNVRCGQWQRCTKITIPFQRYRNLTQDQKDSWFRWIVKVIDQIKCGQITQNHIRKTKPGQTNVSVALSHHMSCYQWQEHTANSNHTDFIWREALPVLRIGL